MASAPLRSLAALAICGRYATTRRLLHSVNAASMMSAIVIPRGHPHWPETVGRLPVANNLGGQDCRLLRSYAPASESLHPAQKLARLRQVLTASPHAISDCC